jgi:hypothetical protein
VETLSLIGQALTLHSDAFKNVITVDSLRSTLLIVFLAGLSNSLGQSIVLFANQVKPKRFIASLAVGALIYVFGFMALSLSIWLVEQFLFDRSEPFISMIKVVGLAYSPYLFSFFILTPYFGSLISVILSLWSLAAILIGLMATLELSIWQAVLASALGWILVQLSSRTIGRPLQKITLQSRRFVAGSKLELNPKRLSESKKSK